LGRSVVGVFRSEEQAERAVSELRDKGFRDNEISIVAKGRNKGGGQERGRRGQSGVEDVSGGVTAGGAIGGLAGLLAGAGALAIPGVGPIVAAGPIAAALSGAVTGGVAGGLLDFGIPEEKGRQLEREVKEGKILALVKAREEKVDEAAEIFRRNGAVEVETH
jgi:hypothetical protein